MLPKITVEARLTEDPTLRFAPSGVAVASFSIVCNGRKKVGDEWQDVNPTFFRCTAFKQLAENIAESLRKGHLAIVTGTLQQEEYTGKDGEKKRSYQNILVDTAGPSLAFATATVNSASKGSRDAAAPAEDVWGSAPADDDPPPF